MTNTLTFPIFQDAASVGETQPTEQVQTSPAVAEPIKIINPNSDFAFAQRAANGDIAAFEEIYQRHHRRVYSVCLRMLQNATEAEDLTQEVLMHFRKRSVKYEKTTEEGETPTQVVVGTENAQKMPIVDKIALDNAIEQLPPGYRNVFVLHDIEGYEHEEVARILGCSVGTSKSQLHKARLKMRKLLDSDSSLIKKLAV